MTDSKDTQEEKSQPDLTILPSCLNLTVHRKEQGAQSNKDLGKNVELHCTKMSKDKGTGEKPTCSNYNCTSEPTLRNCSAINSIQTYNAIPCPKEGQKPRKSRKCWAKSSEDLKKIDLCCPPEVLEHEDIKNPLKIRSSQELPTLGSPSINNTSLFLHTNPDYQCPRLGQESSQGWVTAVVVLGVLGVLVVLVVLGVRWWRGRRARRGRRKKRRSRKKTLRAEEGQDGDGDGGTPGM